MSNQRSVGVVGFGFGEPASSNPNPRIAARTSDLAHSLSAIRVFTDRDVFSNLSCGEIVVVQIDHKQVPTTYRLAVMAIKEAKEQKLDTLYVVAARCHIWRCLRDLRWAARDQGVVIELVAQPIASNQYDPIATTPYTRSAWAWWPSEIVYRIVSSVFPAWYKRTRV